MRDGGGWGRSGGEESWCGVSGAVWVGLKTSGSLCFEFSLFSSLKTRNIKNCRNDTLPDVPNKAEGPRGETSIANFRKLFYLRI